MITITLDQAAKIAAPYGVTRSDIETAVRHTGELSPVVIAGQPLRVWRHELVEWLEGLS